MRVEYLAQPDIQLGRIIFELITSEPLPKHAILVSAFVSLQTIIRLKNPILCLKETGSSVRFVLGIDMGGTSQEVLKEIYSWGIESIIVKHRIPGYTFHPKLYLFEWDDHAEIILGSNNITEGGFFRNYEGSVRIYYDLPSDRVIYETARNDLRRFLDPSGAIAYPLTEEFINKLIVRGEIPTEEAARSIQSTYRRRETLPTSEASPFGVEEIPLPPPLPAELLEGLLRAVQQRQRSTRRARQVIATRTEAERAMPIRSIPEDVLTPAAFYMTLPTLIGKKARKKSPEKVAFHSKQLK